ncbi:ADP-ribosylglycohydrolase family protein [bacterium]|nr:ADP-ribosylglycohydrolase family protein [bacterium]
MQRTTETPLFEHIRAAILGAVVGDVLGVPYEFISREKMQARPATGMTGAGTHQQMRGTWSDDSSMLLCTAEHLTTGFNIAQLGRGFLRWFDTGYMTPDGKVFDFGLTTGLAMDRIREGMPVEKCGLEDEDSNGNGSLMRILPVGIWAYRFHERGIIRAASIVSAITHAHPRSQLACGLYCLVVSTLMRIIEEKGSDFDRPAVLNYVMWKLRNPDPEVFFPRSLKQELKHFDRLLSPDFAELPESEIRSSGYVVHTLEAALWCVLTTTSYRDAVLKAVNLGEDTDTTASVAGGLAGLLYGPGCIPQMWLHDVRSFAFIKRVVDRFAFKVCNS